MGQVKQTKRQSTYTVQFDPLLVGYVRVSTEEQNPDMQIEALKRHGVPPTNIFVEKVSGVSAKRPARDEARQVLRSGMTLVVWKLDRLGRNHMDLYSFVQGLTDNDIAVRSITEYIDTKSPIGKFVLILLSGAAQFEREIIQERTRAGVKRAQERGVKFGQPTLITAEVRRKVNRWLFEGLSVPEIAKRCKLAESTIRKHWKAADIARARKNKGAR